MAADLNQPLITVVTATCGRPRTIAERCLPSVACQDYPAVEHLVMLDGPDDATEKVLLDAGYDYAGPRRIMPLGRNWTRPWDNGSNGAIARAAGGWLAAGEYVHWLDDDNIWSPSHLSEMAACGEGTGADLICSDFAVPQGSVLAVWDGNPPRVGNIDSSSFMVRWTALKKSTWLPDGYTCDGQLAERLVAAGVRWVRKEGATMRITSQRFGAPDS